MNELSTEIRTFYSIKEVRENIETQIAQDKALQEDYSQWLGTLLRKPESDKDHEWVKKTAELQKVLKSGGGKAGKKAERGGGISAEWEQFRNVLLSADSFAEAEILFEAVEQLKIKIDKLEKAKNSLIDLERYGLGKDLLFVTYIHEGVPERIVFKPKKGMPALERFEYTGDFSFQQET